MIPAGKTRKQPAEMGKRGGEVVSCDNKHDGDDDKHDAAADAQGEGFAEDRNAEEHGGDGFQRPEDCRRRGPDKVYGARGAEERDRRGEECQSQQIAPLVPPVGENERLSEIDAEHE